MSNAHVGPLHAGTFRGGRWQIARFQLGPNQMVVAATETGVDGSEPAQFVLDEDDFGQDRLAKVLAALSIIEEVYGEIHSAKEAELEIQGLKAPRDIVHALVKTAEKARADDAAIRPKLDLAINEHNQIVNVTAQKLAVVKELEVVVSALTDKRAEIEGQVATVLARGSEEIEQLRKERADLEAEIQAKKNEKHEALQQLERTKAAEVALKQEIVRALEAKTKMAEPEEKVL